jgi:hypothetical protein
VLAPTRRPGSGRPPLARRLSGRPPPRRIHRRRPMTGRGGTGEHRQLAEAGGCLVGGAVDERLVGGSG